MARRFLNVVSEDDFIFFRLFALVVLGKPGFPYLGVGRGAVSAVFTVTVLFHPFPLWQLLFIWSVCVDSALAASRAASVGAGLCVLTTLLTTQSPPDITISKWCWVGQHNGALHMDVCAPWAPGRSA